VAALVALSFVAGISVNASCGKFHKRMAWGYRALHWTAVAGNETDQALAHWLRAKTKQCLAKHGTKTEGYAKCVTSTLAVVRKWTGCEKAGDKPCPGGVVVSLQKSQRGALDSLETAYNAEKGDVFGAVKPALCALANFVGVARLTRC